MPPRLRSLPPRIRSAPPRIPSAPKVTDAHYGTPAHKAWARAVKERAGWKCEDPDHDPRTPRAGGHVYADHIEERRDAPERELDLSNGRCVCAACHTRKTAKARTTRLSR